MLVKVFQDKTLVLGVQLGRDKAEYFSDVQFIVRVVFSNVDVVQPYDGLLLLKHFLQVLRVEVFLNYRRHTADKEIQAEHLHHLFMNYLVHGLALFPASPQRA